MGTIWHSPLTNLLFPPQVRRLAPSLECQTQHDKSHRNRKNQFPTAYGPTQNVVPRFQDQVRIWNCPVFKLLKYSESTNFCGLGFESATISLIMIFGQSASTVISFLETFLREILGVAIQAGLTALTGTGQLDKSKMKKKKSACSREFGFKPFVVYLVLVQVWNERIETIGCCRALMFWRWREDVTSNVTSPICLEYSNWGGVRCNLQMLSNLATQRSALRTSALQLYNGTTSSGGIGCT